MNIFSRLLPEIWYIAWREKSAGTILQDTDSSFTVLKNRFYRWCADPFVFEHEGKTYIFAELFNYLTGKGSIAYRVMGEADDVWHNVISERHHLSFPNIFENGNDVYIIPESCHGKELYLYRAVSFPDIWEKHRVIRNNVEYVDSVFIDGNTLFSYDIADFDRPRIRLVDISADGEDREVYLDLPEMRRPAGKIIAGTNIRPAQDCSGEYGGGLVFYGMDFSGGEYSEKELSRLYPGDISIDKKLNAVGMHTYNANERYEVIDIKTKGFNPLGMISKAICFLVRKTKELFK